LACREGWQPGTILLNEIILLTRNINASYNETVDILASNNTFNVIAQHRDDLLILTDIQTMLRPSQYNAIRLIELCYHIGNNIKKFDDFKNPLWFIRWKDMCACLEGMSGLQNVHIWTNNEYSYNRRMEMTLEEEHQIFEPLVKVTRPINFEVEVSWPATSAASDVLANAPFKLPRRAGFNCPCELQEAKPYVCQVSNDRLAGDNSSWTSTGDENEKEKTREGVKKRRNMIWQRLIGR